MDVWCVFLWIFSTIPHTCLENNDENIFSSSGPRGNRLYSSAEKMAEPYINIEKSQFIDKTILHKIISNFRFFFNLSFCNKKKCGYLCLAETVWKQLAVEIMVGDYFIKKKSIF